MRRWPVAGVVLLVLGACAVQKPYRVRYSEAGYATLSARQSAFLDQSGNQTGGREQFFVNAINGRRVVQFASEIKIAVGTHRLKIEACDYGLFGGACAQTVLTLDAIAERRYLVTGVVSKSNDYADFWIEDVRSGHKVAGPMRVSNLER